MNIDCTVLKASGGCFMCLRTVEAGGRFDEELLADESLELQVYHQTGTTVVEVTGELEDVTETVYPRSVSQRLHVIVIKPKRPNSSGTLVIHGDEGTVTWRVTVKGYTCPSGVQGITDY